MSTKNIVITAVAAALVVFGLVMTRSGTATVELTQSQINDIATEVRNRLGGVTNYDELGLGNTVIDYHTLTINRDDATSTSAWRNTTGQDVWIIDWSLATLGTASSGMRLFAGTSTINSTSSSIKWFGGGLGYTFGPGFNPFAFGTMVDGNTNCILCGFLVGTSTTATTTSARAPRDVRSMFGFNNNSGDTQASTSILAAHGSSTLPFDAGTTTPTMWRVRPLEYVMLFKRQEGSFASCEQANPDTCETSTSTNNGFDVFFTFTTIATTTVENDPYL